MGKSSSVRDGCVRIMDALADEAQPLIVAERCSGLIRALSQVKPHAQPARGLRHRPRALLASPRCAALPARQPAAAERRVDPPDYSGQVMPRIW